MGASLFSIGGGSSRTQSIDNLKGLISRKGGVANPTLFKVLLPSPSTIFGSGMESEIDATKEDLTLLASSVQIPGRQVMTVEREIGGIIQKVANNTAHADVSMNFRVLNNYGAKKYFEMWQEYCVGQDGDEITPAYATDYCFDVKIQQLKKGFGIPIYNTAIPMPKLPSEIQNRLPKIDILGGAFGSIDLAQGEIDLNFQTGDQVVYECTLIGAFPTTVNAIELSDGSNNQVIELSISLAYRRWRSSGATSNRDALGSIFNTIGLPDIRKIAGL